MLQAKALRIDGDLPKEMKLLSHVAGSHKFYLMPDGRVLVRADSNDEPNAPFYLRAAEWVIDIGRERLTVTLPVVGKDQQGTWTVESVDGAFTLAETLRRDYGYMVKIDTTQIAKAMKLAQFTGYF